MAKSFEYFVLLGGRERSHTKIQAPAEFFPKHSNFDWRFDTAELHSQQQLHLPLTSHASLPEIDKS
jgi:hypothetical protein